MDKELEKKVEKMEGMRPPLETPKASEKPAKKGKG